MATAGTTKSGKTRKASRSAARAGANGRKGAQTGGPVRKEETKKAEEGALKRKVRLLYEGRSKRAKMFRYGLLAFDTFTIGFFLTVSFIHQAPWMRPVEILLSVLIGIDFAARLWIAENRRRYLMQLASVADIIVIVSLISTYVLENLAYLRILRALRLFRSYHVMRDLKELSPFIRRNEQVLEASLNLGVFVFVVSALVYTFQQPVNPAIENYMDALYFTVATLTTTGFGDITLVGAGGRVLAVLIMILGVALFLRLAQALFRPAKVRHKCPQCGLLYHDADATHCKHCGHVLNIPYEGI